jgi:hypothetical protein
MEHEGNLMLSYVKVITPVRTSVPFGSQGRYVRRERVSEQRTIFVKIDNLYHFCCKSTAHFHAPDWAGIWYGTKGQTVFTHLEGLILPYYGPLPEMGKAGAAINKEMARLIGPVDACGLLLSVGDVVTLNRLYKGQNQECSVVEVFSPRTIKVISQNGSQPKMICPHWCQKFLVHLPGEDC